MNKFSIGIIGILVVFGVACFSMGIMVNVLKKPVKIYFNKEIEFQENGESVAIWKTTDIKYYDDSIVFNAPAYSDEPIKLIIK